MNFMLVAPTISDDDCNNIEMAKLKLREIDFETLTLH